MNLIRPLAILICGAFLTLHSLAAAPPDFSQKAATTIIPKYELRDVSPADAFKMITKVTGIPIAYTPQKGEDTRITISLTNVPAGEALRYVTGLANLKFSYGPEGVLVVPNTDKPAAGSAQAAPPIPGLDPPVPGYVVQPAPGAATRATKEAGVTSEFKINSATFIRTLRQATPPRPGETDDLLLARFLKERHVTIQALTLDAPNGRVFVRAALSDMEKLRTLVQQIDAGTPLPAAR